MNFLNFLFGGSKESTSNKYTKKSNKNKSNKKSSKNNNCSNYVNREVKSKKKVVNKKTNKESYKYEYKYTKNNNEIRDENIINKLNSARVPPNYHDVKICLNNSKIMGYGYDDDNRKQIIYNPEFRNKQQKKKHLHLIEFGDKLPEINRQINKDLNGSDIKLKLIALVLKLIQICDFRIGNEALTKKHNHYGVTTLNCNHIKLSKNNGQKIIEINFIGKKGVENYCKFENEDIYNVLNELLSDNCSKNIDSIFVYNEDDDNEDDNNRKITSSDVNDYLKQFGDFSSKNFRTWNANSYFIKNFLEEIKDESNININTNKILKKHVNNAIEKVSLKLHNTKNVCKKEYLNFNLLHLIENNPKKFLRNIDYKRNSDSNYLYLLKKRLV